MYPVVPVARRSPTLSPPGSIPTMPRKVSHAASVKAGSAPTRSRIICQAATLSAPSGAGPIASETEHCGQKQIRRAADFCRGRTPTVCANMYTATDLCPASRCRLQRKQYKFSKRPLEKTGAAKHRYCLATLMERKYVRGFHPAARPRYDFHLSLPMMQSTSCPDSAIFMSIIETRTILAIGLVLGRRSSMLSNQVVL